MVAWGCVWLPGGGMCGKGGMHGKGGGMCGEGGGMHGERGAYVANGGVWQRGGMHGEGGHVWYTTRDTEIRSMSGRYASYWHAFLFTHGNEFSLGTLP